MKRYITLSLALCLILTGCGFSVENAGSLNWNDHLPTETTAVVETGPTLPASPYGPVDFGFDGEYITCLSGDYQVGIDVSAWQSDIDWQQVKAAGIDYVMIRIGWRGSEQGTLFEDESFRAHYDGAAAAGLKIGGYFFSQAVSVEEAKIEAEYVLELLGDRTLQMPLIFDWEQMQSTDRTADMDARTLTDCAIAFCDTVKAAGFDPGIYFNLDLAERLMYLTELTDYRFWLALYSSTMSYPYKVDMWQYTNTGSVPGIEGDVDLNVHLIYETGGTTNE